MKPLVIIPTYNERESIRSVLGRIDAILPRGHVLVVDDNSPDGTAGLVVRLAAEKRWKRRLHLLRRPGKAGLGRAYVAGFEFALAHPAFDPIIQMDADGSHDPEALKVFIKELRGCDLVVGSRYLHGIRIINWPWHRLFLSMAANKYARVVTGIPIRDLTGGYNGIRRAMLARISPETIGCNGYAFQIELKYRCCREAARIKEVPIVFAGRMEGASKLSGKVFWEAVISVWRLRLR